MSSAVLLFFGGGFQTTKIDYRKSWYPYSNLSSGGPSLVCGFYLGSQKEAQPFVGSPQKTDPTWGFERIVSLKKGLAFLSCSKGAISGVSPREAETGSLVHVAGTNRGFSLLWVLQSNYFGACCQGMLVDFNCLPTNGFSV